MLRRKHSDWTFFPDQKDKDICSATVQEKTSCKTFFYSSKNKECKCVENNDRKTFITGHNIDFNEYAVIPGVYCIYLYF